MARRLEVADDDPAVVEADGQPAPVGGDGHRAGTGGRASARPPAPAEWKTRTLPSPRPRGHEARVLAAGPDRPPQSDLLAVAPSIQGRRVDAGAAQVPEEALAVGVDRDEMDVVGEQGDLPDPVHVRLRRRHRDRLKSFWRS